MNRDVEMVECGIRHCNQPKNHDGPHGHDVGGGLVFAPFGHTGKCVTLNPPEETPLLCDADNAPLQITVRNEGGGGTLACTGCEQEYNIGPDGMTSVMVTLYPSSLKRGDDLWPKYVSYREQMFRFEVAARELLGLPMDAANVAAFEAAIKKEREAIVAALPWHRKALERVRSYLRRSEAA